MIICSRPTTLYRHVHSLQTERHERARGLEICIKRRRRHHRGRFVSQ